MVNPNISRRDFLKLAGVTSGGLALTACGLDPTKFPDPTATAAAEALPTGKPPEFPIPLEVISTTEPVPGHPSVVDGLNIGEVTPNNVVGMIPGYESTGINTLYNPNDPSMLITKQNGEQVEAIPPRAFGIDQDQLIQYFNAKEVEGGEIMGDYQGASLTLKNGIWKAATGETFIPFIKAEPNTDAIYLVMDANGGIQKVDITGKAVGAPMPMFETPQAIAARMGFEKADQVVDVEMSKNGSLSFITKEPRPTEKDPNRVVQIVNEVSFLGEPEDLSKAAAADAAAVAFSGALLGAGLNIAAEDIKKNFTIMRVDGLDPTDPTKQKKKNYDVATVAVEDEKVGGDYPLMIRVEGGEWRDILLSDSTGLPIGTTVDLGDKDHSNPEYLKKAKEFGFIVPSGAFWDQYWQYGGAKKWTEFAKENGSGLRMQQVIYANLDTPKDLQSDKESVHSYIHIRNKLMIPFLIQMKGNNPQIVLANEPFWINGNKMMWSGENGNGNPMFSAYGKEWITEAYIDLYEQATAGGLIPGEDFSIIGINEPGIEIAGANTNFVIAEISTIKTNIAQRLNIPVSAVSFDLGIQFHLGKTKGDRSAVLPLPINIDAVSSNLVDIAQKTGSKIHITEVDSIEEEMASAQGFHDLVIAAKQSMVVEDINFWGTMNFPDSTSAWQNPLIKSDYSRTISYYKLIQALFTE